MKTLQILVKNFYTEFHNRHRLSRRISLRFHVYFVNTRKTQNAKYSVLQLSSDAGRRKTLPASEIKPNNYNPEGKEQAGNLARYLRTTPSFRLCCVYTNLDGRHTQKLTMPSGSAKLLENQHENITALPLSIWLLS